MNRNSSDGAIYEAPVRLTLIVVAAILIIETILMIVISQLPPIPYYLATIIDATSLTILLLPFLYFFMFRPLFIFVQNLTQMKESLQYERNHLQELVKERTAKLEESIREIKESEDIYRAVVEGATEGIFTLDVRGHILRANTAGEEMLHFQPGEAIGELFLSFLTPRSLVKCLGSDDLLHPVSHLSLKMRIKGSKPFPISLSLNSFEHHGEIFFTAIVQDISDQVMLEKHLAHMAYYDSLTGLPNRRLFQDRLQQTLNRAKRYKHLVAILFLDLDGFKKINDTLGHRVGDHLLKAVAIRLTGLLRKEDTIAGVGGDEFNIILDHIEKVEAAAVIAKKILQSFTQPFSIQPHQINITASIGITFYPLDNSNIEKLIMNADRAMYLAKSLGKNTYKFYS